MPKISDLESAERDARRLLDKGDLPQPDAVEYRETSIVLLWHDKKVALVIDVDEPPPRA